MEEEDLDETREGDEGTMQRFESNVEVGRETKRRSAASCELIPTQDIGGTTGSTAAKGIAFKAPETETYIQEGRATEHRRIVVQIQYCRKSM